MDKKSFFELWILDSAIRGMDPIARLFNNLYILLFAPLSFFALLAVLTDTNYFFLVGLFLKGVWYFWVKTVWYFITHWDKVVWFFRSIISPGCCGSDPGF